MFLNLLQAVRICLFGLSSQALQGAFTDVLEGTVDKDSFLFKWLDYLSFALRSGGLEALLQNRAAPCGRTAMCCLFSFYHLFFLPARLVGGAPDDPSVGGLLL